MNRNLFHDKLHLMTLLAALILLTSSAIAQGLNWDGQTGALATPFAYTSPSGARQFGTPQAALHFLNGGDVVGNELQFSLTEGVLQRVEFGYSRLISSSGSSPLSPLFQGGYNTFHGKLNFVRENAGGEQWLPALSAGFVARTQVQRVGNSTLGVNSDTNDYDVYVVGTKTITQIPHLPILLNGGVKGTNASLLAIAGNSPDWEPRAFGAVGFVVKGPAKSKVAVGSEFAQEPHHLQYVPGATLPNTLVYFARVYPSSERPLSLDFGVVQAAGKVAPGVDVQARARFAFAVSYSLQRSSRRTTVGSAVPPDLPHLAWADQRRNAPPDLPER